MRLVIVGLVCAVGVGVAASTLPDRQIVWPVAQAPKWVAQVQEPPELPPGEFCQYPEHDKNVPHECNCNRHCIDVPKDGEDPSQGTTTVLQEDAKCKQYCHKDHCHCPVHNCD